MTHSDQDDLVDLALGSPVSAEVTDHVATCPRCAADLADLRRTAEAASSADTDLLTPAPAVWNAILAEVGTEGAIGKRRTSSTSRVVPGPQRWSRSLLAAACMAGITVGSLVTFAVTRTDSDPAPTRLAAAELTPLGSLAPIGKANLVDTSTGMNVQVRTDHLDSGSGYLEVWLINNDLQRMVSIGVLPSGPSSTLLPITQRLIDEGYVVVDISAEDFDDRPQHSGRTLARGKLTP